MRGQVYNVMGTQPTATGTDISEVQLNQFQMQAVNVILWLYSQAAAVLHFVIQQMEQLHSTSISCLRMGTKYLTF
jgi:hypothetical protein